MERNNNNFRASQFRVKYKETALHGGPSGISAYVGTLRKGAVVELVADDHPYYYRVRLDNGLEGYVYKDAGELTSGIVGPRLTTVVEDAVQKDIAQKDAVQKAMPDVTEPAKPSRLTRIRPGSSANSRPATPLPPRPAANSNGYSASSNGTRPAGRASHSVVVTSGEIAIFSKPGIVGQQVGKLKRGERATLIGQDSFFFQVALSDGQTGYLPRYAAELV